MSDFSKMSAAPWVVDKTNALGAYGVWTDYATHPGHDGEGYGSQICSMMPAELPRESRDADAEFIALARNFADVCERNGWSVRCFPTWKWLLVDQRDTALAGPFNTVFEAWQGAVDYDIKLKEKA